MQLVHAPKSDYRAKNRLGDYGTHLHPAELESVAVRHVASAAIAYHRVPRPKLAAYCVLDATLNALLQKEGTVGDAVTHLRKKSVIRILSLVCELVAYIIYI